MFQTPQEFSLMVEMNASARNLSRVESLLEKCSELDIDPLDVGPLISDSLKEKLREEFQELHYLPTSAKLPFND